MTSFVGSNSERQSVGLPGHCDACAERGHVDAHPDLGCSDVGCTSVHPEPVEEAPTVPVAPMVALISYADTPPETLTSLGWRSWEKAVPVHVFHLLRRASAEGRDTSVAPTGWLYTATGARRLDALFACMWHCAEADAVRDVPHDARQNQDPHLASLEEAQEAMTALWAWFLAGVDR